MFCFYLTRNFKVMVMYNLINSHAIHNVYRPYCFNRYQTLRIQHAHQFDMFYNKVYVHLKYDEEFRENMATRHTYSLSRMFVATLMLFL